MVVSTKLHHEIRLRLASGARARLFADDTDVLYGASSWLKNRLPGVQHDAGIFLVPSWAVPALDPPRANVAASAVLQSY
jgi:hypothetical protein